MWPGRLSFGFLAASDKEQQFLAASGEGKRPSAEALDTADKT